MRVSDPIDDDLLARVAVTQLIDRDGAGRTPAVSTAPVAVSGIRMIADRSNAVLGGSGRAEITFVVRPGDQHGPRTSRSPVRTSR